MKRGKFRWALCDVAIATLCFITASYALPEDDSLLGSGRGVDHVTEAVRDLSQAQADFSRLGFTVSPGGHFPGGVYNAIIRLENHGYLELISLMPAPKQDPEMAGFLKKHDGAMGLGLNVSSATSTAAFLRTRQFDVQGPTPGSIMKAGDTKLPPPQWYTLGTADKPAPGKLTIKLPIFFIDYLDGVERDKQRDPKITIHNNTTVGIGAVWFAVHDAIAQGNILSRAGFPSAIGDMRILGLEGQGFRAGSGTLVLLAGNGKDNVADKFLSQYDDGIMALSLEVSDLDRAHEVAESAAHAPLPIYRGAFGQSFLLPYNLTHGIWIEMFKK